MVWNTRWTFEIPNPHVPSFTLFSPKFINPTDSIPIPIRTIEQSARLDVYQMLKPTQIILASSPVLSASKKKTRFACLPAFFPLVEFFQIKPVDLNNRIELNWNVELNRCIWFGSLPMEPNSCARVCFLTPTRSGTLLPVPSTNASSLLFTPLVIAFLFSFSDYFKFPWYDTVEQCFDHIFSLFIGCFTILSFLILFKF